MHWNDVYDKLLKIHMSVYILDISCDTRHVNIVGATLALTLQQTATPK